MQNDAEKYLINLLKKILRLIPKKPKIIDLGAAQSVVIEEELFQAGIDFVCDRSDIQPCSIAKKYIGQCFICPLENLQPIKSNNYDCVFANFVLEHISNPSAAASEMTRILKPKGKLVISLSNPQAPEFRLAKITSTSFHQLFREKNHDPSYPVKYSYGSVEKLIKLFENNGLKLKEDRRFPAIYSYLYHFPILRHLGRAYDGILVRFNWRGIMGHSVLLLEK
jgi:SAM-dependent methyltransferase